MRRKWTSVKRPDFLRMIYLKYMTKEIDFKEFRDRVLCANKTFEWLNSGRVDSRSYDRLSFRLTQHFETCERFLSYLGQGHLTNDFMESATEEDFPRDLVIVETGPQRNEPLFRSSRTEPSIIS